MEEKERRRGHTLTLRLESITEMEMEQDFADFSVCVQGFSKSHTAHNTTIANQTGCRCGIRVL